MPVELFRKESLLNGGRLYLHIAAKIGSTSIAKDLLSKGVDIEICDADGHTARDCLSTDGSQQLVDLLGKGSASTDGQQIVESTSQQNKEVEKEAEVALAQNQILVPKPVSPKLEVKLPENRASPAKPKSRLSSSFVADDATEPANNSSSGSLSRVQLLKQQLSKKSEIQPQVSKSELPKSSLGEIRSKLDADRQESLERIKSQRKPVRFAEPPKAEVHTTPDLPVELAVVQNTVSGRVKMPVEEKRPTIPVEFTASPAETVAVQLPSEPLKTQRSDNMINDLIKQTMEMATHDAEEVLEAKQFADRSSILTESTKSAVEKVSSESLTPVEEAASENFVPIVKEEKAPIPQPTSVESPGKYDTVYRKTFKGPVMVYQDEENDRSPSPKKNVHFGNSWKGTLEKHRKFYKGAAVGSLSKSQTELFLEALASDSPSSYGKLILNLVTVRGLLMDFNKVPEYVHVYCIVRTQTQSFQTKPFLLSLHTASTEFPIHEQFGFDVTDEDATVNIELMVRYELKKNHSKFNPKEVLKRSTGSIRRMLDKTSSRPVSRASTQAYPYDSQSVTGSESGDAISPIHDECICRIKVRLFEVVGKCKESVLERKWSLEIAEKEQRPASTLSRSSTRIYEAGKQFFRDKAVKAGLKVKPPKDSVCEVSEAGTIQMQLFFVGDIDTPTEQQVIPATMQGAQQWLSHKKWHETIWHSGYLSQQGGDVKYWRRRYFTITGAKMEAFHEFKMEYRTTIDLTQLQQVRNLPFALDTSNYPIKNSFRLLFKHGESIDFYAQSQDEATTWMRVFQRILDEIPEAPVHGVQPSASRDHLPAIPEAETKTSKVFYEIVS